MTNLKQTKTQKFLNLTTLNMSFLQHPGVLVGLLGTMSAAFLFYKFNQYPAPADMGLFAKTFTATLLGSVAGAILLGGVRIGKSVNVRVWDTIDKNHSFRANFFNSNFYLHKVYSILKDMTADLKNLSPEKHENYLHKKQAQLLILTRIPMLASNVSWGTFNARHQPLVNAMEANLGIPKLLSGYEKTLTERLQNKSLQQAVKEELLAQNITMVDLVQDMWLKEKSAHVNEKWLILDSPIFNLIEKVFYILAPICLSEQKLSTEETKELCAFLNKIKKQETIEDILKTIVDKAASADTVDWNTISQFIKQNTKVNGVLAHNLQEKISILQTKSGHSSQSLMDVGDTQFINTQQTLPTPTQPDKPLFDAGIVAVLEAPEVHKMCEKLNTLPQTQEIKASLLSLGEELLALEKNKHLFSTENAIELKLIVNKNLPALLHYFQASSTLPTHIQPQILSSVAQTLGVIQDSVEQLKLTMGQNILTNLEVIGQHMVNKNKTLRHAKG